MSIIVHLHDSGKYLGRLIGRRFLDRATLDDAEFKEEEHPRKGGKFVKKGEGESGGKTETPAAKTAEKHEKLKAFNASPTLAAKNAVSTGIWEPLTAHGFKMQKGDESVFAHPEGHQIHIHHENTEKLGNSVFSNPDTGEVGKGGKALKAHLAGLGLTPKPKVPKAAKGQTPTPAPAAAPPATQPAATPAGEPAGEVALDHPIVTDTWKSGGFIHHDLGENGAFGRVSIDKKSGYWLILDKNGKLTVNGTGQESLNKAIEPIAQKVLEAGWEHLGKKAAGPQTAVTKPAGAKYQHQDPTTWMGIDAKHEKQSAERHYNGDPNSASESLIIGTGPDTKGQWQLWSKADGIVGTGTGQDELEQAYNKLHPPPAAAKKPAAKKPAAAGKAANDIATHPLVTKIEDTTLQQDLGKGPEETTSYLIGPGGMSGEVFLGKDSGNWEIFNELGDLLQKGNGKEALDDAFESLHPRGPGGQFAAKPGGVNQDDHDALVNAGYKPLAQAPWGDKSVYIYAKEDGSILLTKAKAVGSGIFVPHTDAFSNNPEFFTPLLGGKMPKIGELPAAAEPKKIGSDVLTPTALAVDKHLTDTGWSPPATTDPLDTETVYTKGAEAVHMKADGFWVYAPDKQDFGTYVSGTGATELKKAMATADEVKSPEDEMKAHLSAAGWKNNSSGFYTKGKAAVDINPDGSWSYAEDDTDFKTPTISGNGLETLKLAMAPATHPKVNHPDAIEPYTAQSSVFGNGKPTQITEINPKGLASTLTGYVETSGDGSWQYFVKSPTSSGFEVKSTGVGQESLDAALDPNAAKLALVGNVVEMKAHLNSNGFKHVPAESDPGVYNAYIIPSTPDQAGSYAIVYNDGGWSVSLANQSIEGHGITELKEKLGDAETGTKTGTSSKANIAAAKDKLSHSVSYITVQDKHGFAVAGMTEAGVILLKHPSNGMSVTLANKGSGLYDWSVYGTDSKPIKEGKGAYNLLDFISTSPLPQKETLKAAALADPGGYAAYSPGEAVGEPMSLVNYKKVGDKLGTTPGGIYQHETDGTKIYVKTQDEDHSRNEALAASLAAAAGVPTFKYHLLEGGGLSSDLVELKHHGTAAMNPKELNEVKKLFAVNAWLANWDVGGAGPEKPSMNMGMTPDGRAICLDWGGSLVYRATGGPKGTAFTKDAGEWDTLRSPTKNPTAAKLFGNMTAAELKASAKMLDNITDTRIRSLVDQHASANLPGGMTKDALADMLIARREAIQAKAKAAKDTPAPPPEPPKPVQNRHSEISNDRYQEFMKVAPKPSPVELAGVRAYTGSYYTSMNAAMRGKGILEPQLRTHAVNAAKYLRKCSWPEDGTIVTRKVGGEYAKELLAQLTAGMVFEDNGFVSTDHWQNDLVMKIKLHKGAQAAAVEKYSANKGNNEWEIMLANGSQFQITSIDKVNKFIECALLSPDHPDYLPKGF